MSANTRAATEASVAARRRRKHERMARELRKAGWLLLPPESLEEDLCGRSVCAIAELTSGA